MKTKLTALLCACAMTLSACQGMTTQQRDETAAAVFGGTVGLITAKAFDADDGWLVASALAGAAAGSLIARNTRTNTCAYADGRGGYVTRPC